MYDLTVSLFGFWCLTSAFFLCFACLVMVSMIAFLKSRARPRWRESGICFHFEIGLKPSVTARNLAGFHNGGIPASAHVRQLNF